MWGAFVYYSVCVADTPMSVHKECRNGLLLPFGYMRVGNDLLSFLTPLTFAACYYVCVFVLIQPFCLTSLRDDLALFYFARPPPT